MRLIDADALEKFLQEKVNALAKELGWHNHYVTGLDDAITYIEDAPTIDAEPVRHGLRIDDLEEHLSKQYGHSWLFDYSEPKNYRDLDEWLQRSISRQSLIWVKKEAARQRGEELCGTWVDDGKGNLACCVCGMQRGRTESGGVCSNCGAKMDAEPKPHEPRKVCPATGLECIECVPGYGCAKTKGGEQDDRS